MRVDGLESRDEGSGFMVLSQGLRVQGLGFKGLEFRVQGLCLRVDG